MGSEAWEYTGSRRVLNSIIVGLVLVSFMAGVAGAEAGQDLSFSTTTSTFITCPQGCHCLTDAEAKALFGNNYELCSDSPCGESFSKFCYKAKPSVQQPPPVNLQVDQRKDQEVGISTGLLSVSSVPSGAEVYVDTIYKGTTPVTVSGLAPGYHNLQLKLTGYQSNTQSAPVSAGTTTALSISLVKLSIQGVSQVSGEVSGGNPLVEVGVDVLPDEDVGVGVDVIPIHEQVPLSTVCTECILDKDPFTVCCRDQCVDTSNDNSNCGGCGHPCMTPVEGKHPMKCHNGKCVIYECENYKDCGDWELCCDHQCVDPSISVDNCGDCGARCSSPDGRPMGCHYGKCVDLTCDNGKLCKAGESCCNGDCVDLNLDQYNCGSCGSYCGPIPDGPIQVCWNGKCAKNACYNPSSNVWGPSDTVCSASQLCCGDSRINPTCIFPQTDRNNCGKCNNKCASNERCIDGKCVEDTCQGYQQPTTMVIASSAFDDGDKWPRGCDNCWQVKNDTNLDSDRDCEYFRQNPSYFNNGFWIQDPHCGDACDNCPTRYNPSQWDYDKDGVGDICECLKPTFIPPGVHDADCKYNGNFFPIRLGCSGGSCGPLLNIVFVSDCPYPGNNFIERNAEDFINLGWGNTTIMTTEFTYSFDTTSNRWSIGTGSYDKSKNYMNFVLEDVNFWASTMCVGVDKRAKVFEMYPSNEYGAFDNTLEYWGYGDDGHRPEYGEYYSFADGVAVIIPQPTTFRNYNKGDGVQAVRTFNTNEGKFGTFMHELSHGVFHLKDEYCCDGGYGSSANVFTEDYCKDHIAPNMGLECVDFCPKKDQGAQTGESREGGYKCGDSDYNWKVDLPHCLMQDGNRFHPPWIYGATCSDSIRKIFNYLGD